MGAQGQLKPFEVCRECGGLLGGLVQIEVPYSYAFFVVISMLPIHS